MFFTQSNRHLLERITGGIKDRATLDDPASSLRECYKFLAMEFNNEQIKIELHPNSCDIEGYKDMDPNDPSRIKIHRDWTWIKNI